MGKACTYFSCCCQGANLELHQPGNEAGAEGSHSAGTVHIRGLTNSHEQGKVTELSLGSIQGTSIETKLPRISPQSHPRKTSQQVRIRHSYNCCTVQTSSEGLGQS